MNDSKNQENMNAHQGTVLFGKEVIGLDHHAKCLAGMIVTDIIITDTGKHFPHKYLCDFKGISMISDRVITKSVDIQSGHEASTALNIPITYFTRGKGKSPLDISYEIVY